MQDDPLHHFSTPSLERRPQIHGPWNRKSISLILEEHGDLTYNVDSMDGANRDNHTMIHVYHHPRHYSLLDLISIGVGGTIGSGIFVLTGFIARHYAGPATFVSFLLSGSAAFCSGLCYAEWSWRVPVEGSTYVYSFVALGEYAAVMAGACLTLEYGVSGAAVARSWGDKVLEWIRVELGQTELAARLGGGTSSPVNDTHEENETFFNPLAGILSLLAVAVLVCGIQESKRVTNFFTVTKLLLVSFMIGGGFMLFEVQNLKPLIPPSLGVTGVVRGATSSFFGYLGFDEVCCLANEAKNPRDLPRAVLWTLAIVTVIYALASIALCGMQNYTYISDTSGFPSAFADRGIGWAAQLTAAGEVFTLPVVVLISLLAQPRLFAAMAKDGLLPAIFAKQNADGNFVWGNVLSGIPMALLATFVPFSWMDDAISVGILFAFNMTNTALIIMKCSGTRGVVSPELESDGEEYSNGEGGGIIAPPTLFYRQQQSLSLSRQLFLYHIVAVLAGLSPHFEIFDDKKRKNWVLQITATTGTLLFALHFHRKFPSTRMFGDAPFHSHPSSSQLSDDNNQVQIGHNPTLATESPFEVPLTPFLPLLGIFLNWYLIAQLDWSGILLLIVFLAIISLLYLWCINGSRKQAVANSYIMNREVRYDPVNGNETVEGPVLKSPLPQR
jgi:amino acid transporter